VKKKGYGFNEAIFSSFMQANELITEEINGTMVMNSSFSKDGHTLLWDNQAISIYTASEKEDQIAKAKILEIIFPSDPEYPEYEYDDEEEGEELAEEEEEDEYEDEYEDEEGEEEETNSDEDYEEEEEIDPESVVQINILDINNLQA